MDSYRLITKLTALTLLSVLAGCAEDKVIPGNGTGFLSLEIECDPMIILPDGSKTELETTFLPSDRDWSISMSDTEGLYSHTWESITEFQSYNRYLNGNYIISVSHGTLNTEGVDSPFFTGETDFTISSGEVTQVKVNPQLANTPVQISFSDEFLTHFPDAVAMLHTPGGEYINLSPSDRLSFMNPGNISVYLIINPRDIRPVMLLPLVMENTRPRYLYEVTFDFDPETDVLTSSYTSADNSASKRLKIDNSLYDSSAPEVIADGFISGKTIEIPEGCFPPSPLNIKINSGSGLSSIRLSVNSSYLNGCGLPHEIDLLSISPDIRKLATALGLDCSNITSHGGILNFDNLAASMIYLADNDNQSTFSLTAIDNNGRGSLPVTLSLLTLRADIAIVSVDKIIAGASSFKLKIAGGNNFTQNGLIEISTDRGQHWTKAEILQMIPDNDNHYLVTVSLPDGTDPIEVRLLYCGTVRDQLTINRYSPVFSIAVDPFVNMARIRIIPENPDYLEMITDYVSIYASGEEIPVISRNPETGEITVIGLNPSTTYNFTATIMDRPNDDDFTEVVIVTTEMPLQLPNADFEEIKESIKWDNLPSGGRYSQNSVAIFNRQNTISHRLSVPVNGWANTNSKTFCPAAANKNSWYMQPSVYSVTDAVSGSSAVKLVSVGYDLAGEPIPDYLQQSEPFINYSRNIPSISHRAAGKLFLGEYVFNPADETEIINEGIEFSSRPLSINGYYKFIPTSGFRNESAIVKVEVLGMSDGEEIVIGKNEYMLDMVTGYTKFTIPIDYPVFGVKATRLKVMFASSSQAGTQPEEDKAVTVHFDPVTASATGNQLWIDNISLGY